jgi:hypothetical protein
MYLTNLFFIFSEDTVIISLCLAMVSNVSQMRATTHIQSANLHFKVSSPWCLMLILTPRVTAPTTPTTTPRYPSSPYTTSRYYGYRGCDTRSGYSGMDIFHRKHITKHRRRHATLLALTYSPGEQTLHKAEGGEANFKQQQRQQGQGSRLGSPLTQ